MSIFSYMYKRVRERIVRNHSSIHDDLSMVFGEADTPTADPNRGTAFWTAESGGQIRQRIAYLSVLVLIAVTVFIFQLWNLQIQKGEAFTIESVQNSLSQTPLFPERGSVSDRDGTRLAWNTATDTQDFFLRSYATSTGFGHLLGYVKYPRRDNNGNYYRQEIIGQAGVERHFQDFLAGQPGRKIVESNALGQQVSESVVDEARAGEDMRLSIDAEVQHQLFSLIQITAEERGFSSGAGVIMNVETGELLAATAYPEYRSKSLTVGEEGYIQELLDNHAQPFLNRVSAGRFTPGSVVKPFMAVAALAENIIDPRTTILSTGFLRVQNPYEPDLFTIFPDWKAHGLVDMRDALAVSSNEYFYQIGGGYKDQEGLGITRIAAYSQAFGLAEETGIQGMSEVAGVIPTPEWKRENFTDGLWRLGDTYNTSIGQYGYQVTPLQMVRAVAAIANSGTLVTPTVRTDISAPSVSVPKDISEADYQVVREGMRQAVTDGTAGGLNVRYVDVAAKTGTAELGGNKSRLNSWIIGFYPYDDPQYAFIVVMAEGPRSNVVGGLYVMRQLLDWMHLNSPTYISGESR
ncbi:MAG: penicillin-binding transpeptidase domain-containing protein [Candidatus Paceibacterota bacterium]